MTTATRQWAAAPSEPATWDALGTYVHLRVADPAQLSAAHRLAREVLGDVDAACSRFRDDSELSAANARAGRWTPASAVLVGALRVALEAAAETDGMVDPTLGLALRAAGYDRTFSQLAPSADPARPPILATPGAWRQVGVRDDAVRVPAGASLDLGATGKAYAADLVAGAVAAQLGVAVVVSVGGDVRADAPPGADQAWPVEVNDTLAAVRQGVGLPHPVSLLRGGIATSSVTARSWLRAGRRMHHVLDPRTGRPATGPWRTVTAAGRSCSAANTASTAALVLGACAPAWLTARGVSARLVSADGTVRHTGAWPHEES